MVAAPEDDVEGLPLLVIERDFAGLLDDDTAPLPDTPIAEDDPFMLIFTSGTTGRPKAAVLSHRCVIGYLMLQASSQFRVPLMFAGLAVIAIMGIATYAVFAVLEARVTGWATRGHDMPLSGGG